SSLMRYLPDAATLPSSIKLSSAITGTSSPPLWLPAMLKASCLLPVRCAVPREDPIAHFIRSKRLPLTRALLASFGKFCDDGSIAIDLCEPKGALDIRTDQ